MNRKITNEVTEGSMLFIKALINDHHADAAEVYLAVSEECRNKALQLLASDPDRNR